MILISRTFKIAQTHFFSKAHQAIGPRIIILTYFIRPYPHEWSTCYKRVWINEKIPLKTIEILFDLHGQSFVFCFFSTIETKYTKFMNRVSNIYIYSILQSCQNFELQDYKEIEWLKLKNPQTMTMEDQRQTYP